MYWFCLVWFLLWSLNLLVVKSIKITLHTRLKRTQPPRSMDRIILVIVDRLVHGATNEPMTSLSKDQLESNIVRSWEELFQSKHYKWAILFAPLKVINLTIFFLDLHHLSKKVSGFFFKFFGAIPNCLGFLFYFEINNTFIMLIIELYNINNHMNIIFIKLMYIV